MLEVALETKQTLEANSVGTIQVPYIIKNKVLLTPGLWNGLNFTGEEIERAFHNTDWGDKKNFELIKDHADKPLSVDAFLGYVKNLRVENGTLYGDLELWDKEIIIKLVHAQAKFGISAKVRGIELEGNFVNFTYANFSVVDDPACKNAYINLSDKTKEAYIVTKLSVHPDKKKEDNMEGDNDADSEHRRIMMKIANGEALTDAEREFIRSLFMPEEEMGKKFDMAIEKIKDSLKKQFPDMKDSEITSRAHAIAKSRKIEEKENEAHTQESERRSIDTEMSEKETTKQETEKSLSLEEFNSKIDKVLSAIDSLSQRVKKLEETPAEAEEEEEEDESESESEDESSESEDSELAKIKKEVAELRANTAKPTKNPRSITTYAELSTDFSKRHSQGNFEMAEIISSLLPKK